MTNDEALRVATARALAAWDNYSKAPQARRKFAMEAVVGAMAILDAEFCGRRDVDGYHVGMLRCDSCDDRECPMRADILGWEIQGPARCRRCVEHKVVR